MEIQSTDKLIANLLQSLSGESDDLEMENAVIPLRLSAGPPVSVKAIPTFNRNTSRSVTPMLKARYSFGSTCQYGCDTWLIPHDMLIWMAHPDVQQYHSSLRQHWANSAPIEVLTV